MTRAIAIVALTVTGFVMSATTVFAQDAPATVGERAAEPLDARWTPWLGCWHLWEKQFEAGVPALDDDTSALVGRTYVCVTPADEASGINLTALAGSDVLVERRLIADGTRRDVREPNCAGWEESEWSRDGQRLFTRAELRCGDQPAHTIDGVSLMTSASKWVDIQIVDTGTRAQIEVRRYTPVPPTERDALLGSTFVLPLDASEVRQARRESAVPLTLADVMEASQKTPPRVVETLLVETEPQLALDSAALIALDEMGINSGVIDLLVALSYPERFVVERRDRGGSWSSGGLGGFGGGFYDPVWYGDLYPYYITPFGNRGWGSGYNPYLFGGAASPFVIVGGGEVEDSSGRAVSARGYTRVRPRDITGAPRMAKPRWGSSGSGSAGGGSTASSGSSGASSAGGAVAWPGGYSGGGSNSGRRAVPRK